MNFRDENDHVSRSGPRGDLESPFLAEELFAGEVQPEWETRLAALKGESPFLAAFEQPGAGTVSGEYENPVLELQAAGISGVDDRTEVRDTTIPPYRWVCSIAYETGGQTLQGGTGVLISDRHVLTAAHVIRDKATAPASHSVYVYPGRHYGGEPFGRFLAARARVSNSRFDFGLLTLERPVDAAVQWWGHPSSRSVWWSEALIPLRELVNPGIPLSTAGYPSAKDRQRRRMYESNGATVPHAFGGVFRHTLDTTEGQSGSPIWTVRNGQFVLVGIVTSYTTTGQLALWIRMVRREVNLWMAEDAPKVQRRIALEIPYRWVCRLEVYDNDLRRVVGYGTGLLISDRHVLTSASVIHGFSRDRRKYSVRVTPGYEFGKEALGSTTASKARVSPRFSPEANDASADFGLLTLSRPLGSTTYPSIGNAALGSWGGPSHGLSASAADWSGKAARLAAFSRSSGGGGGYHKIRVSSGGIVGLKGGQILHKAGSRQDAPGAPIWVEGGGKRLLMGIASPIFSKDSDVNWGCYLSQETLSHLMQWINEDYERKELEAGEHFSQDELESLPAFSDAEAEGPAAEQEFEPYAQDDSPSNEEEYPAVYEAEDAAFEGDASGDAEEPEESRELCYEEETPYEEGETGEEKPLPRMKFEIQTSNRIWRNNGKTASLLERKYGPNDFLVDRKGVRLESETNGVLEFETEWFRSWTKLEEALKKAVTMTDDMNGAAASKFEKSRRAFPFNVDHLRKGSTKELRQGFWDLKPGMEGDKEKILRSGEELEVEIIDAEWTAGIQSSESFLLEYYESFLRQHEWPFYRDGTIKHAQAILDGANTGGITATEVAKLRSLLQIIVNYIMRGQGGKESDKAGAFADVAGMPPKQAFTLMSRTNFASMYKILLTDKEKRLFEKIVKTDAVLKEMGLDRKSPVFVKGYGTKHPEPGPTVHQWLAGIAKGVDLLSVRSGKNLSAAMGRYNVETRRGKKDRWLVKFETRNTVLGAVGIKAKEWVTYAQKLFDTASTRESAALSLLQTQGIADEGKLTNFVFFARHPELGGRRIRKDERLLAQEWLRIRDELARPLLRGVQPELEEFEETGEAFEDFHDAEFVDGELEDFPESLYGET